MKASLFAGAIALGLALTVRCAVLAGEAGTLEPGRTGMVLSGEVTPGDAAERLRLRLEPGTYVAGRLRSARPVLLDLLGGSGTPLRRLVGGIGARQDFYFVVSGEAQSLSVSAPGKGVRDGVRFEIEITSNVAPDLRGSARSDEDHGQAVPDSPRLRRLAETLDAGGTSDAFWQEVATVGTPLVEEADGDTALMTFLYRGAREGVRILGAPSADHDPMQRLGTSDVWYRSYRVPLETRLSYRLAPDVPKVPGSFWERRVAILATAQEDPLNRHPWPADGVDRFNRKSVVELSAAPAQPFAEARADVAAGTVRHLAFTSGRLGNTRRISLYTPPGFDPADPDTICLVLFDGEAYQSEVFVPAILDSMQADGVLPQVVAVLIGNPDMATRGRELPGSDVFAEVVAEEIVPFALAEAGISVLASRTVLAGSSYGGLASMRIAQAHPEVFGNVLSMSGSFWWSPRGTPADRAEFMADRIARGGKADLRVFLSAGLFESGRDGDLDILKTNRHLRTVLEARGYDVTLREYAGGHDYLVWRGALSDGLLALFGT